MFSHNVAAAFSVEVRHACPSMGRRAPILLSCGQLRLGEFLAPRKLGLQAVHNATRHRPRGTADNALSTRGTTWWERHVPAYLTLAGGQPRGCIVHYPPIRDTLHRVLDLTHLGKRLFVRCSTPTLIIYTSCGEAVSRVRAMAAWASGVHANDSTLRPASAAPESI